MAMADMSLPAGLLAALAGLFAVLAGGATAWYLLLRRSRPTRALADVRGLLLKEDWQGAMQLAQSLRPAESAPPESWHEEQVRLEGECLHGAAEAALHAGQYTEALAQYRAVAGLIGLSE